MPHRLDLCGEFTCPLCGSHLFTTSGSLDDPEAEGVCRGKWVPGPGKHMGQHTGCTFRWLRTDDAHVFKRKQS